MSQITEIAHLEPYSKFNEEEVFVCCASYEERCCGALQSSTHNYHPNTVLLFYGNEFIEKGNYKQHLESLRSLALKLTNRKAEEIPFETSTPRQHISKFKEKIQKILSDHPRASITLDITTFPKHTMFPLLREILLLAPEQNLRILYIEPKKYNTEDPGGWLTRGVRSVIPMLGFGGVQDPLLKKLLVMLPGHEGERAYITWLRHQPEKTILLRQGDPYHKGLDEISEKENKLLLSMSGDICVYEHRLPARDIDSAFLELERIYARYVHEYYFVVAPLGTKFQTLGFFLFAESRTDVQVTYAVPIHYNYNNYSKEIGKLWEIRGLNPYPKIDE